MVLIIVYLVWHHWIDQALQEDFQGKSDKLRVAARHRIEVIQLDNMHNYNKKCKPATAYSKNYIVGIKSTTSYSKNDIVAIKRSSSSMGSS